MTRSFDEEYRSCLFVETMTKFIPIEIMRRGKAVDSVDENCEKRLFSRLEKTIQKRRTNCLPLLRRSASASPGLVTNREPCLSLLCIKDSIHTFVAVFIATDGRNVCGALLLLMT